MSDYIVLAPGHGELTVAALPVSTMGTGNEEAICAVLIIYTAQVSEHCMM